METQYIQVIGALVATAVGATGTFLATQRIDRTRWRRERSQRWDESRRQAYTDYASAVKMAIIRSRSILGAMGLN
jgi:hypothetical protein